MKTYTTDKGEQDPDAVCRRDMQIEQHDGECDGEYLFTATIFVRKEIPSALMTLTENRATYFAETVIVKAPAFLFAVKLTMFNPQAITPLIKSATALVDVIWVAPYARTRSSSPVYQP